MYLFGPGLWGICEYYNPVNWTTVHSFEPLQVWFQGPVRRFCHARRRVDINPPPTADRSPGVGQRGRGPARRAAVRAFLPNRLAPRASTSSTSRSGRAV